MCEERKPAVSYASQVSCFLRFDKFVKLLKGSALVPQKQGENRGCPWSVGPSSFRRPKSESGLCKRMAKLSLVVFWKQEAGSETPEKELPWRSSGRLSAWERWRG